MNSRGLNQAYEMQDFAHATAMALREQLTNDGKVIAPNVQQASMLGTLSKVWKDAQEQIRIHRGKPLPGSLTHEKVTVRRGKQARTLADVMMRYPGAPLPDANHDQDQDAQATPTPTTPTTPTTPNANET